MGSSKFNTVLTVLLIIAIIAIIGLIVYFGYSVYNKYYIDLSAKEAVSSFEDIVGHNANKPNNENNEDNDYNGNIVIGGVPEDNTISSPSNNGKLTYHGYNMLGTISIPAIKIEYPILEKVTTNSIKVAVAYLSGPGINKVGNTVIQGHNYRNGQFFSNLSKLSNGDAIYITDTEGTKIKYEVYKNFSAESTDTSFFNRDTAGKREITLSTCTEDAALRTIIFAKEVES